METDMYIPKMLGNDDISIDFLSISQGDGIWYNMYISVPCSVPFATTSRASELIARLIVSKFPLWNLEAYFSNHIHPFTSIYFLHDTLKPLIFV